MPIRVRHTFDRTAVTALCVVGVLALGTAACSGPSTSHPPSETARAGAESSVSSTSAPDEKLPPVPSPYDALEPEARLLLDTPFTGDFDEMVKRRVIRAGVVYNRTQYFVDKGVQRGISYESIR